MKTATVRDLRYDFPKVEAWLAAGEEVVITKRSKQLGTLVPGTSRSASPPLPDYQARVDRIFGTRVFSEAEVEEARAIETGEP